VNILHPVLISIPETTCANTPECVAAQRAYAAMALGRSAALSGAPESGYVKDADEVPLPNAGFHWSVSHKRHWSCGVVARDRIGVDVEAVVPRRDEFFDKVGRDEEWSRLGGRSLAALFRAWTAKEAVLKANGVGIGKMMACTIVDVRDATRMSASYDGHIWLVDQHHVESHVAAVARLSGDVHWHVIADTSR
jgi:4'-phosphopantetheinyl transferase